MCRASISSKDQHRMVPMITAISQIQHYIIMYSKSVPSNHYIRWKLYNLKIRDQTRGWLVTNACFAIADIKSAKTNSWLMPEARNEDYIRLGISIAIHLTLAKGRFIGYGTQAVSSIYSPAPTPLPLSHYRIWALLQRLWNSRRCIMDRDLPLRQSYQQKALLEEFHTCSSQRNKFRQPSIQRGNCGFGGVWGFIE